MNIITPKTNSTIAEIPAGYQIISISDTMQDSERVNFFSEQVQAVVKKQIELENVMNDYRILAEESVKEFRTQGNRNIEILGIFSAVIALLILNVGIVASADTFLKSIILIIGLTCSISIFALLIHSLFGNNNTKLDKRFWIPFMIMSILLVVAIFAELFGWKALCDISFKSIIE